MPGNNRKTAVTDFNFSPLCLLLFFIFYQIEIRESNEADKRRI
jgi:hypothetical protein